jgi:hypothetical protein
MDNLYNSYIGSYSPRDNIISDDNGFIGRTLGNPYTNTGALTFQQFANLLGAAGAVANPAPASFDFGERAKLRTRDNGMRGNLPTMADQNTSWDLMKKYGVAPFTMAANTPVAQPTNRGLTYNNPYNTNPYLPTTNPFALIANAPSSKS